MKFLKDISKVNAYVEALDKLKTDLPEEITQVINALKMTDAKGIYIMGGAVRDYVFDSVEPNVKDYDIVVDSDGRVNDYSYAWTILGNVPNAFVDYSNASYGKHCMTGKVNGIHFAIMSLRGMHAFKEFSHLTDHSIKGFLKTTFLNCNALAYDCLKEKLIISDVFHRCYTKNLLDVNFPFSLLTPEYTAARIFRISTKLELEMTSGLNNMCHNYDLTKDTSEKSDSDDFDDDIAF